MSIKQKKIIEDFGNEWKRFDQIHLSEKELKIFFDDYFNIFPFNSIGKNSEGFDLGSGTGRWAYFISDLVGVLNLIEPSSAIEISKKKLMNKKNINFYNENVSNLSLKENTQDFGYSLGVLHHVEDTESALLKCNKVLKKDAPFLLYLYYAFDNRSYTYKFLWKASNIIRILVCNLPNNIKNVITDLIAFFVYWPLAKISFFLNCLRINTNALPLNYYKNASFYTMRTDSRDRFGTKLEKRFSKNEITKLLERNGFKNVSFSSKPPFWVSLSFKK